MKNRIVETLVMVGIPVGMLGFKYIRDAIILLNDGAHENPQWTVLYMEIAERHNVSFSSVERAINLAFQSARNSAKESEVYYGIVEHYLGFINTQNSKTLALLNLRIKQDMEEEDE